jgi:hypothetical protein
MKQEEQKQLTITFGKYRGQPVERLSQDEAYAKWLVGQDWCKEKYPGIYTFIIHNYRADPIDTPEHNQMQVKFLNQTHALKLAYLYSDKKLFQFNNNHFHMAMPKFLSDLRQKFINPEHIIHQFIKMKGKKLLSIKKIDFEQKGLDVQYSVSYGYSSFSAGSDYYRAQAVFDEFWNNELNLDIKVELKPYIGDDFPTVLRQMKTSGAMILVIREYNGAGASYDEFKQYFNSQGIRVFKEEEIENTTLPTYDEVLDFNESIMNP